MNFLAFFCFLGPQKLLKHILTSFWCSAPKGWSKYTSPKKDFDLDYDVKVNLRHHILSLLTKNCTAKVGFARQGYLSVRFWLFEKPNVFESQARCDTPLIFQLHPVTPNQGNLSKGKVTMPHAKLSVLCLHVKTVTLSASGLIPPSYPSSAAI